LLIERKIHDTNLAEALAQRLIVPANLATRVNNDQVVVPVAAARRRKIILLGRVHYDDVGRPNRRRAHIHLIQTPILTRVPFQKRIILQI
jgi:hypothetical protein